MTNVNPQASPDSATRPGDGRSSERREDIMQPEHELTLDDMLADPLIHLMMRRDGVEEAHVRALFSRLAQGRRPTEPRSFAEWSSLERKPGPARTWKTPSAATGAAYPN
jgi:hypothetical protein